MIFVEIHGMKGICMAESSRNDFIHRVKLQLQKVSINPPKNIFINFSGLDVTDVVEEKASNFCFIHVGPTVSTKDLNLLIKILKHESCLGDHIMLSNIKPVSPE